MCARSNSRSRRVTGGTYFHSLLETRRRAEKALQVFLVEA
jgi:hypothetical protein